MIMSTTDSKMPQDWHFIKSVLLKEIFTSDTYDHICKCCLALSHARRMAESIGNDQLVKTQNSCEKEQTDRK
jgi:hypothetical protein